MAIAAGASLLAAGAAFTYWHYLQRQWCVQFTSSGGQEVTYSRGCYNPERYKKWTTNALAPSEVGNPESGIGKFQTLRLTQTSEVLIKN